MAQDDGGGDADKHKDVVTDDEQDGEGEGDAVRHRHVPLLNRFACNYDGSLQTLLQVHLDTKMDTREQKSPHQQGRVGEAVCWEAKREQKCVKLCGCTPEQGGFVVVVVDLHNPQCSSHGDDNVVAEVVLDVAGN